MTDKRWCVNTQLLSLLGRELWDVYSFLDSRISSVGLNSIVHSKSGLMNAILYGLPSFHCLPQSLLVFSLSSKQITYIKSYLRVCFSGTHSKKVGNISDIHW